MKAAGSSNNGTPNNNTTPITFLELLTIAFIVLRLCGVIHWNYAWILSPLWVPALVVTAVALVITLTGKK